MNTWRGKIPAGWKLANISRPNSIVRGVNDATGIAVVEVYALQ